MFRSVILLVGGLASLSAVSLSAQDAILGQKYGQGVHDYFSGDYLSAYEQLTTAIKGGSKDPRAFYFRGLAYLKLGRGQEAAIDFRKGAELEAGDINKFYNASKALERVQGSARTELENYRVNARMAVMERAEKLRKARYEALQREETRVLRMQPLTPPEPIQTPKATVEPAAEPEAVNPIAAPPAKPAAKPAAEKKGGVLGAMGKALGKAVAGQDDKPAAEKKQQPANAENPFGEAPAAQEKPADEAKPAEKADPNDPFAP